MSKYGRQHVSRKAIFAILNDYDIFQHYCRNFNTVNHNFSSELRADKNPSCIIGRYNNTLYYRDFSENKNYDCVSYIMRKFGVNFIQSLNMINRDFDLGFSATCSLHLLPTSGTNGVLHNVDIMEFSVAPTIIKVKARKWVKEDGNYWKSRYGINQETLMFFNVVPITRYWIIGRKGHTDYNTDLYSYAYFCGYDNNRELWKIYQPSNKNGGKWISNVPSSYLQGYDQLSDNGDLLIITKSLKDVMVLSQLGYNTVAPHGETFNVSDELISSLSQRFDRVIILYDNDESGIKASKLIAEKHTLEYILLPEGTKDASDFVEAYDYPELNEVLQEMLER